MTLLRFFMDPLQPGRSIVIRQGNPLRHLSLIRVPVEIARIEKGRRQLFGQDVRLPIESCAERAWLPYGLGVVHRIYP